MSKTLILDPQEYEKWSKTKCKLFSWTPCSFIGNPLHDCWYLSHNSGDRNNRCVCVSSWWVAGEGFLLCFILIRVRITTFQTQYAEYILYLTRNRDKAAKVILLNLLWTGFRIFRAAYAAKTMAIFLSWVDKNDSLSFLHTCDFEVKKGRLPLQKTPKKFSCQ